MGVIKNIGNKSYTQDANGEWYELESPVQKQPITAKVVNGKQYHQDANGDWYEGEPIVKKKEPTPSTVSVGKSGLQETPKKFTTSVVFPELDNQVQPVEETDPIALAKQADALSKETVETNTGGGGALMYGSTSQKVPNTESVNKANEIYGNLEKLGYNGKEIAKDMADIPDFVFNQKGFTKSEILDDYKNNKPLYVRKVATATWQPLLMKQLKEAQTNPDLKHDAFVASEDLGAALNTIDIDGDYASQRDLLNKITNIANKFGGDNKDKILRNLGVDISYIYGKAASDPNFIMKNAGSKLNNLQAVATNYLQDIHPEELRKYTSAFLKDEDIKDNDNAKLAKEEALKRLEEIGINLNKSYLQEKLNPIKKEYDILWNKSQSEKGLSVEELDRAKQLEELGAPYQSQLENVNSDEQQLLERYPNASYYDVNQFSQELLGQKYNWGTHALMKVGEAIENTGAGVYDFVASPFRSKSEDEIRQADVLGEGIKGRNLSYVTGISGKPVLSDALKSDIDKIKNDKLLSDDQKAKEVNQLLMKRNGEWYKDPESHLSLKSLAYGITDMATALVPFIGLEMITGGGATAGVVRKFTSSFISAVATSFEDSYRNGIEKGVKNPYAYATRVTAINSAAIAGAGTASEIRAMFSKQKTPIGDLVMKMSDSEIEAALKEAPKSLKTLKGTLEAARNKAIGGVRSISKDAVSSFKEAAKINAAMSAGNITNDAISGELKSPVEYGKDFLLESLKFGIFGTAMRTGTKIIRPSDMSMAALYEAGANKDIMLSHLDEKIKSGEITQSEGQEIKRNIEDVSKIIKKHSEVLSILHDKQKREYLYNALKEQRSRSMAEVLPEKQAEKYDIDAEAAKFKNSYLIEPKTPEQLEKRKSQLEKSLIPEKDADGKNIEIPQQEVLAAKAEMQAINEVLEEHKKANEAGVTKTAEELFDKHKNNPIFMGMADNPEAAVKHIADQAQNMSDGKPVTPENPQAYEQMVKSLGGDKELVDAAIAKHPKPKVEGTAPPKVTEGKVEDVTQQPKVNEEAQVPEVLNPKEEGGTTNEGTNTQGTGTKEGQVGEGEWWSSVRKAKLKEEISGVKEMFEKRVPKGWKAVYNSALENLGKMYPKKSLYDAMKTRVNEFVAKVNNKELFNPTSEDIAIFNLFKAETQKRIGNIEGIDSDNNIVREAALAEFNPLHEDLINVARVVNPNGEAGRAFGMLQSEVNTNDGLKIRRMELMKAKGGEKLTPDEEKWTAEKWEQEKELMKQEEAIRTKAMQDEFENKISELQKDYEEKLKSASENKSSKTTKEKTLSQKGKDVADKIRKLKKPKGSTNIDFTLGTWDIAIEGIAKLVEGGATVSEAISKMVKDGIIAFREEKDKNDFENYFAASLGERVTKEDALSKIAEFAKENDVADITNEMVGANLIRDYVESHIGEVDKKDIFNEAYSGLKKVLPDISKQSIVEAYLKKGDYKIPTKKQLKDAVVQQRVQLRKIAKSELTASQEQKIKLEQEKENTIRKIKDFERKLDEGEFEEPVPVKLKKYDAELIRLKKQQSIIEEAYRKKQHETQEKNKTGLERAADFLRSTYVAILIGAPKTLLKVGSMSVMRPLSEIGTKATFGKVFSSFFPNISKAAERGGESSSWMSIKTGMEAYFRQMGDKKMEDMYERANNEYNNAVNQYRIYKSNGNPNPIRLKQLKDNINNKLLKVQGSFIYKFIGGSSLKDVLNALVNRSNEIEKQFGKVEGESIKEGNWLDKTNYVLGFIGRSHSALKTFSGRFSFAAGFMARLEGALKNGEDISSPDKVLEIAHESYLDWERGKYQQSNQISDLWNKLTNHISEGEVGTQREGASKIMAALLRTEVAITRVPVNILHEAVMEYTLGAFKAAILASKEVSKIKGELKTEGLIPNEPEFKAALKERISQMDEKQAATIARCFRKGGLGVGLYALALISGAMHFGIFPHMGQKKKKEEEELGIDELNPGQVMLGNKKFGEVTSGIIEHIPALWTTFMGLGMAQAYDDEIKKGKTTKEAVAKSIYTHLKIVEGQIPQSKIISPTRVGETIYQGVKKKMVDAGILTKKESGGGHSKPSKNTKAHK